MYCLFCGFAIPVYVESSTVSILSNIKKKNLATSIGMFLIPMWNFQEAAAGDDDDLDLFGDETEEDKKAAEEREAAKKPAKKKESKFYLLNYLTYMKYLSIMNLLKLHYVHVEVINHVGLAYHNLNSTFAYLISCQNYWHYLQCCFMPLHLVF